MADPTALRLHDNQSFPDQLGYAVHQTAVPTMAHLKPKSKCAFLERYGVKKALRKSLVKVDACRLPK
eukprot:scaffold79493_cov48-Attheya_sp.AAC.1